MISQVNMKVTKGRETREIWFLFETGHTDLYQFNEDLAEDKTVYGYRIETVDAGPGQRRETTRYEFIVGVDAVLTVSPTQVELLPPEVERA